MQVSVSSRFLEVNELEIECGDLAREIGKFYMADLRKAIQSARKYGLEKVWFAVNFRKNPIDHRKMHLKIGILDRPLTKLRESFDLWVFDYHKEELTPLWSLPHRYEMKTYLKAPENYSPELIKWIRQFVKQEGLDLDKMEKASYKL